MLGYIKGKVLSQSNGMVLIENNGIGYEVCCSSSIYNKLCTNKEGEIFTYLAVREDGVYLYGFSSLEEKKMFLELISVSGVGPKMGITILSNMNVDDLVIKIATSDVKGLSAVKGLGKKTAERIIVELREKFSAIDKGTGEVVVKSSEQPKEVLLSKDEEDAIIALMGLGMTRKECIDGVKSAKQNGAKSISEIISYTLKNLR